MSYFNPIDGEVTPEFCQQVLNSGRMPTALCVFSESGNPDKVLTLDLEESQSYVLPAMDMGGLSAHEPSISTENFLAYRSKKRLGTVIGKGQLKVLPVAYEHGYWVKDLHYRQYPNLHYRTFVPAFGVIVRVKEHCAQKDARRIMRPIEEVRDVYATEQAEGYDHIGILGASIEALDRYSKFKDALGL